MRISKSIGLAVVTALIGVSGAASAGVVYTYTGGTYTVTYNDPLISGTYTSAMAIKGQFSVADPIQPGAERTIATTAAQFSFSDGLRSITNTSAIYPSLSGFRMTTNSSGAVVSWNFNLWGGAPGLYNNGDEQWTMSSGSTLISDFPANRYDRADITKCVVAGCAGAPFAGQGGLSATKGSWTVGWGEDPGTDAGDLSAPQAVTSPATVFVSGSVGPDDPVDAFSFGYSGGPLTITLLAETALDELFVGLYRASNLELLTEMPLSDGDSLPTLNLAMGNYVVKVATSSNVDPPFTLGFSSFIGPLQDAPPPNGAPEPGTLVLLSLGLAGLFSVRRRKQ